MPTIVYDKTTGGKWIVNPYQERIVCDSQQEAQKEADKIMWAKAVEKFGPSITGNQNY